MSSITPTSRAHAEAEETETERVRNEENGGPKTEMEGRSKPLASMLTGQQINISEMTRYRSAPHTCNVSSLKTY